MPVRKRFFMKEIATKIKQDLINRNTDLNMLQTVSIGDIELMPSPETLRNRNTALEYLPAVYIVPENIFTITASSNKSIAASKYEFTLRYVHYYDINNTNEVIEQAMEGAELVAETLLEDHNLVPTNSSVAYITINDLGGNPIGHILQTEVPRISFNSIESEIFDELKIPVILIDIEYTVTFRSLYVKGA